MHRLSESSEAKGSKHSEMEITPEAVGRSTKSAAGEPTTRLVCPFTALEHLATIGRIFNDFYQNDKFTDVRIETSSGIIRAHLNVLAAHSGVFQRKAREDPDLPLTVRMPDSFNGDDVKLAIDYVYAGEVSVLSKRIPYVLEVAEALELAELKKLCEQHLPEKSQINDCPTSEKVIGMLAQRFASLSEEELTALTIDDFCQLLCSDQLTASSPVHVFRAAVVWLMGHPESEHLASRIFDCIDFSLLPEEVLKATIEKSRASSGPFNSAVHQKATEVLRARRHGNLKNAKSSATQTPSPGGQEEQCGAQLSPPVRQHVCALGIRAIISIQLNGKPVLALLDTGAEKSLVCFSALEKDAVVDRKRRFDLVGSNNLPVKTIGASRVVLQLGTTTIQHDCAVWENDHAPAPVLLGIDILRLFNEIHLRVVDGRLVVQFMGYDGRNRDEVYQLEVCMLLNNERPVSAIIDSGSDITLVRWNLIAAMTDKHSEEQCQTVQVKKSPLRKKILGVNGLPLETDGLATLCVQLEDHAMMHDCFVASELQHDAVLGIDFIAQFDVVIINFAQCQKEIAELRGPPFRLAVKFLPKPKGRLTSPSTTTADEVERYPVVRMTRFGHGDEFDTATLSIHNVAPRSVVYRVSASGLDGVKILSPYVGALGSMQHTHLDIGLWPTKVDLHREAEYKILVETCEIDDDGSQPQPMKDVDDIWSKQKESLTRKTTISLREAMNNVKAKIEKE